MLILEEKKTVKAQRIRLSILLKLKLNKAIGEKNLLFSELLKDQFEWWAFIVANDNFYELYRSFTQVGFQDM